MTTYLSGGWYRKRQRERLRDEVIDGAMDVAGTLVRGGVPARRLLRIALRVRTLVIIADPLMRGGGSFGEKDRAVILHRLTPYTDDYPELHAFVADCLDRVNGAPEMTAFYLHLVHVARMMQLLAHALDSGLSSLNPARRSTSPTKKKTKRPRKKTKAGKTKKKSPARSRAASKTVKKSAKKRKTAKRTKR